MIYNEDLPIDPEMDVPEDNSDDKFVIDIYEELLEQIFTAMLREDLKHLDTIQIARMDESLSNGYFPITHWYREHSIMIEAYNGLKKLNKKSA